MAVLVNPPCVVFEDDHLLVVNKPPGWNTHSPAPYAGEGIYEWLKNREPRWAKLAIIHRLDKETSGLLVFSKTPEGNRSLTQQFTDGKVRKEYVLQCAKPPDKPKFVVRSNLKRAGERYVSSASGVDAETEFEQLEALTIVARPRTGRTHQIRVHAAENGFPIRGDVLYGGEPFNRVCLHAARIEFSHPQTKQLVVFEAEPGFNADPADLLRAAIIVPSETDAYRLNPNVDRFGDYVLIQTPEPPKTPTHWKAGGIYHKTTTPHVRGKSAEEASPRLIAGKAAHAPFAIHENGVQFEINFGEGYSVGIFLDQRENRRRLLTNYIAPDFWVREGGLKGAEVLNTFAYTCAFSVSAALSGAHLTSLDLSKKYLDWGRRNFHLNGLKPEEHDFIYGDVFDWLKRLGKKGRLFDVVLLDPPTFSKSKESGLFRAEHDYPRLVGDALKLLKPGGVLFASSNAARWAPEDFVRDVHQAIAKAGRKILKEQYVPQPPDFPISKAEPAYLKTLWMKIT
jgi:23S rRNA (cytosine1962-C5)-methyltransferase